MENHFEQLEEILTRNKQDCANFMEVISPKIEGANDEHERLYWHHIYEEEEQRLDRLNELLPKLDYYVQSNDGHSANNLEFIHMLQDISLEKFGLHNFEEHLDLGLYWYKDTEDGTKLEEIREVTSADYQRMKEILNDLNQRFDGAASKGGSTPTDDKDDIDDHLKALKYTNNNQQETETVYETEATPSEQKPVVRNKKRLTVGSLKK